MPTGDSQLLETFQATVARLNEAPRTPAINACLVEVRRVMSTMARWRAVPPSNDVRERVLERIGELVQHAQEALEPTSNGAARTLPRSDAPDQTVPSDDVFAASDEQVYGPANSSAPAPPASPVPAAPAKNRDDVRTSPVARIQTVRRVEPEVRLGSGVLLTRSSALLWEPHPTLAGVSMKLLERDPDTRVYTALIRLAPGACLPRHRHAEPEEVFVVQGVAQIGATILQRGDFCFSRGDTIHEAMASETGCVVLLRGSEDDETL